MSTYDLHRRPAEVAASTLQTLEAIAPQPTLRIRVEHSRTIKDGWGYSTTVEVDGIDESNASRVAEAIRRIAITLEEVRVLGEHERDIRNQRDTAAKEATAQIAGTAS